MWTCDPKQVHFRQRLRADSRERGYGEWANLNLSTPVFRNADTLEAYELVPSTGLATSVDLLVRDFSSVQTLMVPDTIATLIMRGSWHEVVCRTSWPNAWLHTARDEQSEFGRPDVGFEPQPSQLSKIAQQLREWTPRILGDGGHDHLELEQAVQTLESWSFSLSCREAALEQHVGSGRNKRYDPLVLLRTVFAVMDLKRKSSLHEVMKERIIPLMPAALQSLSRQTLGTHWSLPTPSTRLSLILDTAVMLDRRAQLLAEGPLARARYGFADSSPQADRDWLIATVRSVKVAELGA